MQCPTTMTINHNFRVAQASICEGGAMDQDHRRSNTSHDHPMIDAALEYTAMLGWTSFIAPVGTKKSHKSGKRDANIKN